MSLWGRVGVGVAMLVVVVAVAVAGPARGATLVPQDTSNATPVAMTAATPAGVWFQGDTPTAQGETVTSLGEVTAGAATSTLLSVSSDAAWSRLASGGPNVVWRLDAPQSGHVLPRATIASYEGPELVERGGTGVDVPKVPASGLAVDATGQLWIGDGRRDRVARIGLDGVVHYVPLRSRNTGRAKTAPLAVAPAGRGQTWAGDGRVLSLLSAAGIVRRVRLPFAVHAMARDAARSLWIVGATGRLARVSPTGAVRVFAARVPGGGAGTIVAGPSGHAWLTVPGTSRLVEVTTRGRVTVHRLTSGHGTAAPVPRALTTSGDGKLWVLTRQGLATVNLTGRSVAPAAGTVDAESGCRFPAGSQVYVHSAGAALASTSTPGGDGVVSWWVCAAADHRVLLLQREGWMDGPALSLPLLQGSHLGYLVVNGTHYGGGAISVCAGDLAKPRSLRCVPAGQADPFGYASRGEYWFAQLVLGQDGAVAWLDREDDDRVTVLRPGAAAPEVVATGTWNTLAELGTTADAITWTENGEPRSAPL